MSEIIFPDSKIITNNNDENHLRAYLTNSFDGKSSVKLEVGFYRLVCSNGAIIGEKDELMIFRHVSDITSSIIDKFRLYMTNKLDYVDTFIKSLDQMDFKDGTEIEKVMMDGKIVAKKYGEEMLETWSALDKVRNAWIIYNIFTEMITHKVEATMFGRMKMLQNLTKHFDNMIQIGG